MVVRADDVEGFTLQSGDDEEWFDLTLRNQTEKLSMPRSAGNALQSALMSRTRG